MFYMCVVLFLFVEMMELSSFEYRTFTSFFECSTSVIMLFFVLMLLFKFVVIDGVLLSGILNMCLLILLV